MLFGSFKPVIFGWNKGPTETEFRHAVDVDLKGVDSLEHGCVFGMVLTLRKEISILECDPNRSFFVVEGVAKDLRVRFFKISAVEVKLARATWSGNLLQGVGGVTCMLATLQQAKHHIVTAFGISDSHFGSHRYPPLQGLGQGNGGAPAG